MVTINEINNPDQTSKGDLIVGTGGGSRPAVLSVGSNTYVLTADSGQTTGMKWAATGGTGSIIQMVSTSTNSAILGANTMSAITSAPQNTNGTQLMTVSITPTNSSSILYIEATVLGWANGGTVSMIALFQDSTAGALCTQGNFGYEGGTGNVGMRLCYTMTAGTTSSTTFKIRGGTVAGGTSFYMNTYDGANSSGSTLYSVLSVWEIHV